MGASAQAARILQGIASGVHDLLLSPDRLDSTDPPTTLAPAAGPFIC